MRWLVFLGMAALCVPGLRGADSAVAERPPEEIIAELDGLIVPRTSSGWIQAKMEGVALTLRFYDAKAKQVAADVDRASVRFVPPARKQEFRALIPWDAEKTVFSHGQPVRHPHVFKLYVSFFRGESEEAVEHYVVDYP